MFKFHCHGCQETFRVYLENLAEVETLKCQNCGFEMPQEAVMQLNILGKSYQETINCLFKTNEYKEGWSITIEEYDVLRPDKVSQFENVITRAEDYYDNYWKDNYFDKEQTLKKINIVNE